MNEATAITLFIYGLCCLSAFVAIWCTTWGLWYLFNDKAADRASEGSSWVCDRCSDLQPGSDTPHHYPPNHVCGDCYEVEQDARREGREDERTGYQRRDGF